MNITKKAALLASMAAALAVSSVADVTVEFGAGSDINAGGLTSVADGDRFNMGKNGVLGNTDNTNNEWDLTFVDGANSVTLRLHLDIVGSVLNNSAIVGINTGESVALSFEVLSGELGSISLDTYAVRALSIRNTDGVKNNEIGRAGEGFSLSDNSLNTNTIYGIREQNATIDLLSPSDLLTDDPNYNTGTANTPGIVASAGLNVLDESNIDSWSWTIAGVDPGIDGGSTTFALNKFVITVSAIPEPASLGMLAIAGGGIMFLRRRVMK